MNLPRYSASASSPIDNSYVLDVAASIGGDVSLVAAACSSGAVRVFAAPPSGGCLASHGGGGPGGGGRNAPGDPSAFAHAAPATALAWHGGGGASGGGGAALLSASKDGTVACWDVRAGSGSRPPAARLRAGEPLHSVCFVEESVDPSASSCPAGSPPSSSSLVAAGGDGRVFLFDARTGGILSSFEETHEGDVSCLVGAPARPGALRVGGGAGRGCFLSAGVDGLVAVWDVPLSSGSDPSRPPPIDEDDAFVTALNANTTISRLGLCSPSSGRPADDLGVLGRNLWATTGVEGMLTWDWAAACDESDSSGGLGASSSFEDARESLRATAKEEGGATACDYVVGCVAVGGGGPSPSSPSALLLAAGDHAGRLALFPLGPPASRGGAPAVLGCVPMAVPSKSGSAQQQQKQQRPPRGHSATVRAIVSAAPLGRALATGAEDGLVVLWSADAGSGGGGGGGNDDDGSDDSDDDGDGSKRRRALSSSIPIGVSGGGLTKKKKKRRHKKKKGGGDAVAMAIE